MMILVHFDETMIHLMQYFFYIFVGDILAVILHFWCFDFHKVV